MSSDAGNLNSDAQGNKILKPNPALRWVALQQHVHSSLTLENKSVVYPAGSNRHTFNEESDISTHQTGSTHRVNSQICWPDNAHRTTVEPNQGWRDVDVENTALNVQLKTLYTFALRHFVTMMHNQLLGRQKQPFLLLLFGKNTIRTSLVGLPVIWILTRVDLHPPNAADAFAGLRGSCWCR